MSLSLSMSVPVPLSVILFLATPSPRSLTPARSLLSCGVLSPAAVRVFSASRSSFFRKNRGNTQGAEARLKLNALNPKRKGKASTVKAPVKRGGVSHRALADTWSEKDNVGVSWRPRRRYELWQASVGHQLHLLHTSTTDVVS